MPWVIWIIGLPGSGKSTAALAVKEKFPDAVILNMDKLRKIITPKPTYSDTEREYVYRAIVFTAKTLYELGHNVIIDATANKKSWRELARKRHAELVSASPGYNYKLLNLSLFERYYSVKYIITLPYHRLKCTSDIYCAARLNMLLDKLHKPINKNSSLKC